MKNTSLALSISLIMASMLEVSGSVSAWNDNDHSATCNNAIRNYSCNGQGYECTPEAICSNLNGSGQPCWHEC